MCIIWPYAIVADLNQHRALAEHYMMYQKAKLFSDEEAASAILKMPTPRYETLTPSKWCDKLNL